MILSHADTTFSYRRQLLTSGIVFLIVMSVFGAEDDAWHRSIAPFKVVCYCALGYGFVRLFLPVLVGFWPSYTKPYAHFCYYAGLAGVAAIPILAVVDPDFARGGPYSFGSPEYFSEILPGMGASLFAAAAGFNWLSSSHVA